MEIQLLFTFFLALTVSEGAEILQGVSINNYGIFGGQTAAPGQFPFQISLQRCSNFPWKHCEHFCGGSIISPSWILTAGHCWDLASSLQVVAGIVNRSEESEYRQTIETNQTFVHENYIGNANPNDIRVYQLKSPLVFNDRVQPIALPIPNSDTTGDVVASGWGYISGGLFPVVPDALQFQISNMPLGETCLNLTRALGTNHFNATTNVCTENPEKNHGICNGDSGGPLVQNGTLYGISSWGFIPCGGKGAPSVFTRVSNYIDWIKARVPEL